MIHSLLIKDKKQASQSHAFDVICQKKQTNILLYSTMIFSFKNKKRLKIIKINKDNH